MTKEEFLNNYWNYYLLLEKKVINLQNYITFSANNGSCYSIEIMNLIINICCEIDVIFKIILGYELDKFKTISDYKKIYNKEGYEEIDDETLYLIDNKDYKLIPFENFKPDSESPVWWEAFDDLKHKRTISFNEANLKNLLNALGALYILEIYYFRKSFFKDENDENVPCHLSELFLTTVLKSNVVGELNNIIIDEFDD